MRIKLLSMLIVVACFPCPMAHGKQSLVVVTDDSLGIAATSLPDSVLWHRAIPIYFKVNRTYIPRHDEGYRRLGDELAGIGDKYEVLRLMVIRGSASPEGGYANNRRLARGRAKAIIDSLSRFVEIPDSVVELRFVDEDYDGLHRLIEEGNAPLQRHSAFDSRRTPSQSPCYQAISKAARRRQCVA